MNEYLQSELRAPALSNVKVHTCDLVKDKQCQM